jgi:hypothetical protein
MPQLAPESGSSVAGVVSGNSRGVLGGSVRCAVKSVESGFCVLLVVCAS